MNKNNVDAKDGEGSVRSKRTHEFGSHSVEFCGQQLILQAQVHAERTTSGQAEWFISDRSGADPIIYARKYVSEDAAEDLAGSVDWLQLRDRMRKSMVIVCEAGADWLTDDGVRLMPESGEEWISFHELFCSCLDKWEVNYRVLLCDITEAYDRLAFVLKSWDGVRASRLLQSPNVEAETR